MAINIPDGFKVSAGVPIDSRFQFATLVERDALEAVVRYEGLECYVKETALKYMLKGGVDNADWIESGRSSTGVNSDGNAVQNDIPIFNSAYEIVKSGLGSRVDTLLPGYVSLESFTPSAPLLLHGGGMEKTTISDNGLKNLGTDVAPFKAASVVGDTANLFKGKNFYISSDLVTNISYIAFSTGTSPDPDEVADGREVSILNSSSTDKTFVNAAATDPSGSSIITGSGSDVTLSPGQTFTFKYSSQLAAWGLVGSAASGGGQSLDTAFQLYAKEDLSEWSASALIDGVFEKETVNPLNGKASYKFTRGSISATAFLVSPPQDIAKRFRGQTCTLYFPYSYNGLNGIVTAQLYDNTNATLIPGVIHLNGTNGGIVIAKVNVVIPLTCESVDIIFRLDGSDNGKVLQFDDVQLTSDTTVYADIANITQSSYMLRSGVLASGIVVNGPQTHSKGAGVYSYDAISGKYTVLRPAAFTLTISSSANTSSVIDPTIRINGALMGYDGSVASMGANASFTISRELEIGDYFDFLTVSGATQFQRVFVTATASNPNIITSVDTFSSDTAPFVYAGSSQYTLATLENAPIGTFITFTYTQNSNTRTQTNAAPPSQTMASMNQNGIGISTRSFGNASGSTGPTTFAIQIGKGMKGVTLELYKSAGKINTGSLDRFCLGDISTTQTGLSFKEYSEKTGILLLDAGYARSNGITSNEFLFSDMTTQSSGYITINASKVPGMAGIGVPTVAARAVSTSGQAIGNSPTLVTWDALKTFDTHGALNPATGLFTSPESGYYDIDAHIYFQTAAYSTGQGLYVLGYLNGVLYSYGDLTRAQATTTGYGSRYTDKVFLNKGDTFSLYAQNERGSTSLSTTVKTNYFSIAKINVG